MPALRHKIVMAPGKNYSATVSAHTRVLLSLGFEGEILRTRPTGTWVNGAYTYTAADSWLDGGLGDLGEREAARDLAVRWLCAFGPATFRDLQWWTGWTAATTRRALADWTRSRSRSRAGRLCRSRRRGPVSPGRSWAALLPGLDPTTMGWKDRDWYLPPPRPPPSTAWATPDRRSGSTDGSSACGPRPGPASSAPTSSSRSPAGSTPPSRSGSTPFGDRRHAFTVRFPSPVSTALAKGEELA